MLTPTQKEAARFLIRRYLERCEDNKAKIHYQQFRPMNHFNREPTREFTCDCSGLATSCFRWADIHLGVRIHDPNGLDYNGYGFTGTLLSHNKKRRVPHDRKFFVGDLAIYGQSLGDTRHVAICRKDGNSENAIWTSHGSEGGPYAVYLHYRSDLLVVVRSEDLV